MSIQLFLARNLFETQSTYLCVYCISSLEFQCLYYIHIYYQLLSVNIYFFVFVCYYIITRTILIAVSVHSLQWFIGNEGKRKKSKPMQWLYYTWKIFYIVFYLISPSAKHNNDTFQWEKWFSSVILIYKVYYLYYYSFANAILM